jgi:antitoxin (DNA-binding transcriptional repressor) of toxin-antitoxin stability system
MLRNRTCLSLLRARAGEDIVIVNGKTPVARLTPIAGSQSKRKFGAYKGQLSVPDSFFDPLPEDELKAWEGEAYDGDPLGHPRAAVVDERRSEVVEKGTQRDRKRRR